MARGAWLDFVGLHPKRGVTALAEALRCVRHLLRRSTEPLPGEFFPLAGGDTLRWPVVRPELPFLLGTWGEQTIRACIGDIAAVKIGGSANPGVLPHFRRVIDEAAAAAGRDGRQVEIVIGAVCVVDEDGAAARALARREVALYLPVVAELDPSLQLDPVLLARIKEAAARYDFAAAGAFISDDLLRCFAFAGTPQRSSRPRRRPLRRRRRTASNSARRMGSARKAGCGCWANAWCRRSKAWRSDRLQVHYPPSSGDQ